MRPKDHITTIALCGSLIAHGLGLSALAWWVVMTTPKPHEAAIDPNVVLLEQLSREMASEPKPEPKPQVQSPPPKPQEKKHKPVPPAAKESEKFQKPDDNVKDDSGEHDGIGNANRSNHGDKPMQAPQSLVEQADLMKQDASKFDNDSPMPASAGKKDDDSNINPRLTTKTGDASPLSNDKANGTDDPAVRTSLAIATDKGALPLPKPETEKNNPKPTGEKNPGKTPAAQPAKPQSDLKEVRGKKTEISDTESVALAKAPALTYQAGQLLGRKGLKVQTREPRYGYSSEVDLESLGYPSTVMGVKLDADGNVLDVKLLESSGSSNIDHDRMLAVWHWVLEPAKDKDGNITDFLWTVTIK